MEFTTASIVKGVKEGNIRTFKISDQTVDRDNDIIVQKNMNLTEFRKNPVIMYVHSANRFPDPDLVVGKSPKVWYENEKTELYSKADFDVNGEGELSNVLAKKVLYKIDDGQLSMSSIGFGVDHKEAGYGKKDAGENESVWYWRKTELHEWSVVPVPSNRNASVQRAFERAVKYNVDDWRQFIDKEGLKGDDLESFLKQGLDGAPDLLYLETEYYKAPSAITFHFDIPKVPSFPDGGVVTGPEIKEKAGFLYRQAVIRQTII
jgi:hypothetical protein